MHCTEGKETKKERKKNEKFLKRVILKHHKNYRKLHGVKKLKWNGELAKKSTRFCKKLAKKDKFEHSNTNAGNFLSKIYNVLCAMFEFCYFKARNTPIREYCSLIG